MEQITTNNIVIVQPIPTILNIFTINHKKATEMENAIIAYMKISKSITKNTNNVIDYLLLL